jgi:hypothetical protein
MRTGARGAIMDGWGGWWSKRAQARAHTAWSRGTYHGGGRGTTTETGGRRHATARGSGSMVAEP